MSLLPSSVFLLPHHTGPIGWMAFKEDEDQQKSTGNYGILDIQSALRWVQKEIRSFGGDPSHVLIHGQVRLNNLFNTYKRRLLNL